MVPRDSEVENWLVRHSLERAVQHLNKRVTDFMTFAFVNVTLEGEQRDQFNLDRSRKEQTKKTNNQRLKIRFR